MKSSTQTKKAPLTNGNDEEGQIQVSPHYDTTNGKPATTTTAEFLTTLFSPHDCVTLRPIELWTEEGRKRSKVAYKLVTTVALESASGPLAKIAGSAEELALNQFFGVCPRFAPSAGYDRAWQIRQVNALWCDIDNTTTDEVLERCRTKGLPEPSIVVASGNGVHLYWVLDSPFLIDDAEDPPVIHQDWPEKTADGKTQTPDEFITVDGEQIYLKRNGKPVAGSTPAMTEKALLIQDIVAGIADAIGGDHTQDLSRLLRLPGTLNRKNQRMGATPTECRVHSMSGHRYSVEAFATFAVNSPQRLAREKIAKVKLPPVKKKVAQRDTTRLHDLVNACAMADLGQRSECDFSLCCYAIERGIPRDVVWSACHDVGKFVERGEAYFHLTWGKAELHAREGIYRDHCETEEAKRRAKEREESAPAKPKPTNESKAAKPVLFVQTIDGDDDEAEITDNVIQHVAKLGVDSPWIDAEKIDSVNVYQRVGQLVHVVAEPEGELRGITIPEATMRIRELPRSLIRERTTQAVTLMREKLEKHGDQFVEVEKKCPPPAWLIASVAERGSWPSEMRQLSAIVRCPTIRPDGTVLHVPGYDPKTMLLYAPNETFPAIPERPTESEVHSSVKLLREVVCDYPFLNAACESAWVSLVLTLLGRPIINGPTPLHLFDASTRGTGKSLLCDVAFLIAFGSRAPRKTWPAADDAELRKTITSVAVEGIPAVAFDNVIGSIGGASLDAALTSTVWQDRLLGANKTTGSLPLTTVWMASGNNLELLGDTERRTLFCRLESPEEFPENRPAESFKHPHLIEWVTLNRVALAVAGLTIIRGWFAAGCEKNAEGQWGSFEAWNDTIRQIVTWAGMADPLETKPLARAASRSDSTLQVWHAALSACDPNRKGITAAKLFAIWESAECPEELKTAVGETIRKPSSHAISVVLRSNLGRRYGGHSLQNQVGHGSVKTWFLLPEKCSKS